MALPWESNSEEILSKNKSVYENAVTGISWSCMLLLIGSLCNMILIKAVQFPSSAYEVIFFFLRIFEACGVLITK